MGFEPTTFNSESFKSIIRTATPSGHTDILELIENFLKGTKYLLFLQSGPFKKQSFENL